MDYQDFTIEVSSAAAGKLTARVVEAPVREWPENEFAAPIAREDLAALPAAFNRPGAEIAEHGLPVSPRELGEPLYSAVFAGEVAALFQRCRSAVDREESAGLRLRLRFRLDDPEAEYLAALPWEWLWDSTAHRFLAIDLGTPVVRDLVGCRPRPVEEIDPPLRILVVDAAPYTLHRLNLKLEIERMAEALEPLIRDGWVELKRLDPSDKDRLRDELRDEEIHVLHFMGHGGYDPESGTGAVFFVGDDGREDQVSGSTLADYLLRIPSLRLVVLNACKTASFGGKLGSPFNHGVAHPLLARTRTPAVVANQYTISDDAAVAFSRLFYGRIASGDGVDEALTDARLKLKARSWEWATPVLFLTAPDGRLFRFRGGPPPRPQRAEVIGSLAQVRTEPPPVRLGVRSRIGFGADMEQRNDAVLDLVRWFDDRFIKDPAWWQEKVFPELRELLLAKSDPRRPLLLDFAAHASIAFAAGWVLEPKSGLDVRVRQRISQTGELEWSPTDGREGSERLWLERPDVEIDLEAPDVAVALSVSQPALVDVEAFVRREGSTIGRIGRIVDATIAPEPGPRSVHGGAHSLRLAQALLPRLREKRPHERGGRLHFFCAGPNALLFYLGQLAAGLPGIVLYEYPFGHREAFGRYQKSIELPPPEKGIPW